MLNHIVIMGRLTRNPELRRTASGKAVASFTLAVDRDFSQGDEKQTDFIDCVAWQKTGEFVSKYFAKGSMIVASGRLQIRGWTDKDGNKRRTAEVVADSVYFGERKNTDTSPAAGYQNSYSAPPGSTQYLETEEMLKRYGAYNATPTSDFAMLEDDDAQLPF